MNEQDRDLLIEVAGYLTLVRLYLPAGHHLHTEASTISDKIGARLAERDGAGSDLSDNSR
jgi:hypothetical protein